MRSKAPDHDKTKETVTSFLSFANGELLNIHHLGFPF